MNKALEEIKKRVNAAPPDLDLLGLSEMIKPESEEQSHAGYEAEVRLEEFITRSRTDIKVLVKALERTWQILEKMRSASSCDFNEMPYWANKAIVESESILNGDSK